jgi:hypothetical protein
MTTEHIQQLLLLLSKIADKPYTITGAADWPILAVVGGILLAVIGAMWADLRAAMKEGREEWRQQLNEVEAKNDRAHDLVWEAMRDCQSDCCPRKRGRKDD